MRDYTITRTRQAGEDYETMIIRNRETGADVAEYRLTAGRESAEIAAMRRAINAHLRTAGATLGNYQW